MGVGVLLAQAPDASAAILYNWSGTCTWGCDYGSTSTATLELNESEDSEKGILSGTDFLSFSYTSSRGSFTLANSDPIAIFSGRLPAPGSSGAGALNIVGFSGGLEYTFQRTSANGSWSTYHTAGGFRYEQGYNGSWSGGPVDLPAPGSLLAMLGVLLAGTVVYGYHAGRREDAEGLTTA